MLSRNNFSDPQTTKLNKTRREHFWSSGPQKTPTIDQSLQNGTLTYIFRYFAIPVLYIII